MEGNRRKRVKQELGYDEDDGIVRSLRDVPPADYTLKIESFSLLLETKVENYESRVFEAGGCKWKLCLCPQGNKIMGVNDHISLYLKLVDTEDRQQGWEIIANFKLFVLDQIRSKFLTIQEVESCRRYNEFKSVWGFDRLIALDTFKDVTSGFLLDDCCVFGAEIFVIKYRRQRECLSTVKLSAKNTYTWTIKNFSNIHTCIFSDEFVVGDLKWKLWCYPKGQAAGKGTHMSVFLYPPTSVTQVYVKFKIRVKDQKHGISDYECTGSTWFSASIRGWGFQTFLSLKNLEDETKGYIVNGSVIIEGEIIEISSSKDY